MQTELFTQNYYNTTNYTGVELTERTQKATSQQESVWEVFKLANRAMAWWEVAELLPNMNEVSLKRCITNLKTERRLLKTNEATISPYGHRSKKYTLNAKFDNL